MPIRVAGVWLFIVSTVAFAQREEKPESGTKPSRRIAPIGKFPQRVTGPTYVTSGAISYLSRRLGRLHVGTGDERTWISVPKDCQITVAGKPASLDDLATGQWVKINYGARLHDAVWIIAGTRSGERRSDRANESTISSNDSSDQSGSSAQQPHDTRSQTGESWTANEDSKSASSQNPASGHSDYKDGDVAGLRDQLVKASPAARSSILEKVRDAKGALNTNALASAIPLLQNNVKMRARDALAERLSRMTRSTLKEKLRDQNDEVRRAAALACAMKEEKALIPDLIDLLADPKPRVGRAARASLMALTDEDFGPTDSAAKDRVTKSAELWRQWWVKNRAVSASSGSSK
jgi:hypothetical protein